MSRFVQTCNDREDKCEMSVVRADEFFGENEAATDSFRGKCQLALVFDNVITENDTGIIFSDKAFGMVRKNEITI